MKKSLVPFSLIAIAVWASSGCTTVIRNPEDVAPVAAAAPAPMNDAVQTSSAAPRPSVQELAEKASRELRFETNSAELKPAAISTLRELAQALADEASAKVAIHGYTDSTGGEQINKPLSVERAKSVSSVLQKSGIPTDRVSVKGLSSRRPVADNSSVDGRAANRRAEISVN